MVNLSDVQQYYYRQTANEMGKAVMRASKFNVNVKVIATRKGIAIGTSTLKATDGVDVVMMTIQPDMEVVKDYGNGEFDIDSFHDDEDLKAQFRQEWENVFSHGLKRDLTDIFLNDR